MYEYLVRLTICIKEVAWVYGLYGMFHFGSYGFRKWYWDLPMPDIEPGQIAIMISSFVFAVIILFC